MGDGRLVLVGPGSEWFWAMLQFVMVAVTLLGIYHQLRLMRSANAFEHMRALEAEWQSPGLQRARLLVLEAVKNGESVGGSSGHACWVLTNYWEAAALLVHERHVDERLVFENEGLACAVWWQLLEPWISEERADTGQAQVCERFEQMAARFRARFAALGSPAIDAAFVARQLDRQLERARQSVIAAGMG
ncbi:MAG TPA: hypothetical protein VFY23_13235 [Candidatus Limnocylindrales bacterium]|nr:hypothetical protein [Candidatus Limnocylindrales bacterium]